MYPRVYRPRHTKLLHTSGTQSHLYKRRGKCRRAMVAVVAMAAVVATVVAPLAVVTAAAPPHPQSSRTATVTTASTPTAANTTAATSQRHHKWRPTQNLRREAMKAPHRGQPSPDLCRTDELPKQGRYLCPRCLHSTTRQN